MASDRLAAVLRAKTEENQRAADMMTEFPLRLADVFNEQQAREAQARTLAERERRENARLDLSRARFANTLLTQEEQRKQEGMKRSRGMASKFMDQRLTNPAKFRFTLENLESANPGILERWRKSLVEDGSMSEAEAILVTTPPSAEELNQRNAELARREVIKDNPIEALAAFETDPVRQAALRRMQYKDQYVYSEDGSTVVPKLAEDGTIRDGTPIDRKTAMKDLQKIGDYRSIMRDMEKVASMDSAFREQGDGGASNPYLSVDVVSPGKILIGKSLEENLSGFFADKNGSALEQMNEVWYSFGTPEQLAVKQDIGEFYDDFISFAMPTSGPRQKNPTLANLEDFFEKYPGFESQMDSYGESLLRDFRKDATSTTAIPEELYSNMAQLVYAFIIGDSPHKGMPPPEAYWLAGYADNAELLTQHLGKNGSEHLEKSKRSREAALAKSLPPGAQQ